MAYTRYDVDVNQVVYSDYEGLRKENLGRHLNRKEADTLIELCGLPSESPKVFGLMVKYELLYKHGKAAGTYYTVPKEQPPYSRFEGLEKEYYNGHPPKEQKPEPPKEKVLGRVVLNEEYCVNYLKERGYMCFKLTPNLLKLQQAFTPQFLLENMEAELK